MAFDLPNGPVALIGFGEAAQALVEGMGQSRPAILRGFDLKVQTEQGAQNAADFARFNVVAAPSSRAAVDGAAAVLSLVTADQSLIAARTAAEAIGPSALFLDANSVSPQTKRSAADAIKAAGGRYVDVAVMAPVRPALTATPLLVSGPHAEDGAAALRAMGFSKVQIHDGPVGAASAVKMIRSIMVKGVEALTAECLAAAVAAGVDEAVIASLDASKVAELWTVRGDYNLDRMMIHGLRRAEEMREVVATLEELGVTPAMSRATVAWQAAIGTAFGGDTGQKPPPQGYRDKIDLIRKAKALP